jgi:AcrR family transcriptional regulator
MSMLILDLPVRVTEETREETRKRILRSARRLFRAKGYAGASTRQIASAAGIAAGTLFNYFPGKEALAMSLVGRALEGAEESFLAGRGEEDTLQEDLSRLVVAELDELKPLRPWVGTVLETALNPFRPGEAGGEAERVKARHLRAVDDCVRQRFWAVAPDGASKAGLELYWTLYLGVLAFWSRDGSPDQQETRALVERYIRLFVESLGPKGEGGDVPA